MTAYYNEIDPYAAQWLRNLIEAGHIAYGVVDERSIEDVQPDDLRGYTQCHFFAGIGVWSAALRRAGWPDDRPVWTGSCPCQPFSAAGKGLGFADERHLWPAWHWLIGECRPAIIFGEQVASSSVGPWIDLVHADVEALDYAYGCVPFPSASVGAPHIRDRNFWLACANERAGQQGRSHVRGRLDRGDAQSRTGFSGGGVLGGLADSANVGFDGRGAGETSDGRDAARLESERLRFVERIEPAGPTNGFWRTADWLLCRDEKWRPVEPGTFPLADGAPSRVGRLRAYGNAINAPQAEEFIRVAMECLPCEA